MTQIDTWLPQGEATAIDSMNGHHVQKDRIVKLLATTWYGAFPWVCGTVFLSTYMPTYSQRIGELLVDGYPIERATCRDPAHEHSGGIAAYRMIGEIR